MVRPLAMVPFVAGALLGCANESHAPYERTARGQLPIINGASSNEDQNAVILIGIKFKGQMFPNCSGTLVAKNLVLTARHCVGDVKDDGTVTNYQPEELFIFSGTDAPQRLGRGAAPAAAGKQLFTVGGNFLLPDVAFIVLDTSLNTSPVAPIRLNGGAVKGEELSIVGYGINEKNELPTNRKKRDGVSVAEVGPAATRQFDLDKGEFVFGEAACSGDSGGPALSAKTKAVVGVASRVSNGKDRTEQDPSAFCIGTDTENVYTDLSQVQTVLRAAFLAAGADPILEASDADPKSGGTAGDGTDPAGGSSGNAQTTLPPAEQGSTSGCSTAPSGELPATPVACTLAMALVLAAKRRRRN